MELSINIKEIHDHIDILRREKEEVQALIADLKILMRENDELMAYPSTLFRRQLEGARKESANIQRRIDFLESAAEEFESLKRSTDNIFTDARDLAAIYGME